MPSIIIEYHEGTDLLHQKIRVFSAGLEPKKIVKVIHDQGLGEKLSLPDTYIHVIQRTMTGPQLLQRSQQT